LASEDPTVITRERADLTAAGAGGGRGGRGAPSGRGAINLGGPGRGAGGGRGGDADEKGWARNCAKAPRFTNDTSRVTTPSIRP